MQDFDFHSVPIVDYLLTIGEPIVSVSNNYYRHKEHDSLVINSKRNYFVWNSRLSEPNSKGGAVQYLQIVHGLSLHEAMDKVKSDFSGKTLHKAPKRKFPSKFNYRVKEVSVPLAAQRYLVAERKIPNAVVKYFFSIGLVQQNENEEILFKWLKGEKIVGFSKQGTVPLTEEQKQQYHTKRDYFKYVAPTTEKDTYWGFNYLKGEPQNIYFFESPIDLLSFYSLKEKELKNNFWLISIDGVSKEKIFAFLKYGAENYNLEQLETLNICFDNDKAGKAIIDDLSDILIAGKTFKDYRPTVGKDWNDCLIIKYKQKRR